MKLRSAFAIIMLVLGALVATGVLHAQTYAGAPLPGVTVTLKSKATAKVVARETSDVNGCFAFKGLKQDTYLMSISAAAPTVAFAIMPAAVSASGKVITNAVSAGNRQSIILVFIIQTVSGQGCGDPVPTESISFNFAREGQPMESISFNFAGNLAGRVTK